jgi:hypothetical protein
LILPSGPLALYIIAPNPFVRPSPNASMLHSRPRPIFLFTPEARRVVDEINEFMSGLGSPPPPPVPSQNRLINARNMMSTRYKAL